MVHESDGGRWDDQREWWQTVGALQEGVKGLPGFAGLEADGRSVTVAWKGPLPPAGDALLARLPASVHVRVVEAPYDQEELLDAGERLMAGRGRVDGSVAVASVGPMPDGSGLAVEVLVKPGGSEDLTAAELGRRMSEQLGVHCDVELVTDLPQALTGRGRSRHLPAAPPTRSP